MVAKIGADTAENESSQLFQKVVRQSDAVRYIEAKLSYGKHRHLLSLERPRRSWQAVRWQGGQLRTPHRPRRFEARFSARPACTFSSEETTFRTFLSAEFFDIFSAE